MALQKCGLNLNQGREELKPHGTPDFPCAGYSSLYQSASDDVIPWHWHKELEFIYIKEGGLNIKTTSSKSLTVRQGDLFAINSNILHYGTPDGICRLLSLVFSSSLVSGEKDSVFAQKYMQPLTASPSFSGCFISGSEYPDIISYFCRAFDAMKNESAGFEFTVRENLSRICLFLTQKLCSAGTPQSSYSQDNLRIRKMLEYIHKHYSDAITLSEIARAADIGERECLRCFQKTIQFSPIQYVLKYRIMQGAKMLLSQPESSISDISLSCGFDSPSHFARTFRHFYGCSPREYRKTDVR